MKKILAILLIVPLIFLFACDRGGKGEIELDSEDQTDQRKEADDTTGQIEMPGVEKKLERIQLSQMYEIRSGAIYDDNNCFFYFDENGQLNCIESQQFSTSFTCYGEMYTVAFTWTVWNNELYIDTSKVVGYTLERIEGNTTHVLLQKEKRYFVCDLINQTIETYFKDVSDIDQLELSADLKSAVYTTGTGDNAYYYNGSITVDMLEACGVEDCDVVGTRLSGGSVLLYCVDRSDIYAPNITVYLYDPITETAKMTIDCMPLFMQNYQEDGVTLRGKRYGSYNGNGVLTLIAPQNGSTRSTGIPYKEIELIFNNTELLCVALSDGTLVTFSLDTGEELLRSFAGLEYKDISALGQIILPSVKDLYLGFTNSERITNIYKFADVT